MARLLSDSELEKSCVVANCRMNRERELTGRNGYQRELGLHPLDFLRSRVRDNQRGRWLDLCCGAGRALIQAAELAGEDIDIVGIDLIDHFWPGPRPPRLRLLASSLTGWRPDAPFDLITCVHGLHYLGDKLGVVARAVSWLTADGCFAANLDVANLRDEGRSAGG